MKRLILLCMLAFSIVAHGQLNTETTRLKHTFAIRSGYGNMLRGVEFLTIPTDDYKRSLRDGVSWSAGYSYQITKVLGMGFLYSGFSSTGKHEEGADHLYTAYLAPQLLLYGVDTKRISLIFTAGAGVFSFRNKSEVFEKSRKVTATSFGANIGLNLTYKLTPHWGIGADCQLIASDLSRAESRYRNEKIEIERSTYARTLTLMGGISYRF